MAHRDKTRRSSAKRKETSKVISPHDRTPYHTTPEGDMCSATSARNLAKSQRESAKPLENTAVRIKSVDLNEFDSANELLPVEV